MKLSTILENGTGSSIEVTTTETATGVFTVMARIKPGEKYELRTDSNDIYGVSIEDFPVLIIYSDELVDNERIKIITAGDSYSKEVTPRHGVPKPTTTSFEKKLQEKPNLYLSPSFDWMHYKSAFEEHFQLGRIEECNVGVVIMSSILRDCENMIDIVRMVEEAKRRSDFKILPVMLDEVHTFREMLYGNQVGMWFEMEEMDDTESFLGRQEAAIEYMLHSCDSYMEKPLGIVQSEFFHLVFERIRGLFSAERNTQNLRGSTPRSSTKDSDTVRSLEIYKVRENSCPRPIMHQSTYVNDPDNDHDWSKDLGGETKNKLANVSGSDKGEAEEEWMHWIVKAPKKAREKARMMALSLGGTPKSQESKLNLPETASLKRKLQEKPHVYFCPNLSYRDDRILPEFRRHFQNSQIIEQCNVGVLIISQYSMVYLPKSMLLGLVAMVKAAKRRSDFKILLVMRDVPLALFHDRMHYTVRESFPWIMNGEYEAVVEYIRSHDCMMVNIGLKEIEFLNLVFGRIHGLISGESNTKNFRGTTLPPSVTDLVMEGSSDEMYKPTSVNDLDRSKNSGGETKEKLADVLDKGKGDAEGEKISFYPFDIIEMLPPNLHGDVSTDEYDTFMDEGSEILLDEVKNVNIMQPRIDEDQIFDPGYEVFKNEIYEDILRIDSIQELAIDIVDMEGLLHDPDTIILSFSDGTKKSFEFYFKSREDMARIVGVGFKHAKVTLEGEDVTITEIMEEDWNQRWRVVKVNSSRNMKLFKMKRSSPSDVSERRTHLDVEISSRKPLLWKFTKYFSLEETIATFASKEMYAKCSADAEASSSGNNEVELHATGLGKKLGEINKFTSGEPSGDENVGLMSHGLEKLMMDSPENSATTVKLQLLSGGRITEKSDGSLEHPSRNIGEIVPNLEFTFFYEGERRMIRVIVGEISFKFSRDEITGDQSDWYHTQFRVIFGLRGGRNGHLERESSKHLNTSSGKHGSKTSYTHENRKGKESENSFGASVKGGFATFFQATGQGSRTRKTNSQDAKTNLSEKSHERTCEDTEGGLVVNVHEEDLRIVCNYYFPGESTPSLEPIPSQEYIDQGVKFEGTWIPEELSTEFVDYFLCATRILQEGGCKDKKYEQEYLSTILVNHSLSHLEDYPIMKGMKALSHGDTSKSQEGLPMNDAVRELDGLCKFEDQVKALGLKALFEVEGPNWRKDPSSLTHKDEGEIIEDGFDEWRDTIMRDDNLEGSNDQHGNFEHGYEAFKDQLYEDIKRIDCIEEIAIDHVDTTTLLLSHDIIILSFFDEKEDIFEFYFKDREDMASIVGVGLEHAVVILESGEVTIKEITDHNWNERWKNLETNSCKKRKLFKMKMPTPSNAHEGLIYLDVELSHEKPLLWELTKYFSLRESIETFVTKDIFAKYAHGAEISSSASLKNQGEGSSVEGTWTWILRRFLNGGLEENGNEGSTSYQLEERVTKGSKDTATIVKLQLLHEGYKLIDDFPGMIKSNLELQFINEGGDSDDGKEVKIKVGTISFKLGRDMKGNQLPWYHKKLKVMFGFLNGATQRYGEIKDESFKSLEMRVGTVNTKTSSSHGHTKGKESTGKGSVSIKPYGIGASGDYEQKCILQDTGTETLERSVEISNDDYTKGGLILNPSVDEFHGRIVCDYSLPREAPSLGPPSTGHFYDQFVMFEGTWLPIGDKRFAEYTLEATRDLCHEDKRHQQTYTKTMLVNHSMTHLDGKTYRLRERKDDSKSILTVLGSGNKPDWNPLEPLVEMKDIPDEVPNTNIQNVDEQQANNGSIRNSSTRSNTLFRLIRSGRSTRRSVNSHGETLTSHSQQESEQEVNGTSNPMRRGPVRR